MAKGMKTGGRNFAPGVSGNPKGAEKLPEDIKAARALTRIEFEKIANQYLHMTREELAKLAKDQSLSTLEGMIVKLIERAIDGGDEKRLGFLLEQLLGPVPKRLELSGPDGKPIEMGNARLTDEQLDAKIAAHLEKKELK